MGVGAGGGVGTYELVVEGMSTCKASYKEEEVSGTLDVGTGAGTRDELVEEESDNSKAS